MFSLNRNSYLQNRVSYVNARIINRCVDLARDQPCLDPQDFESPMQRLVSQQPCIPVKNTDVTRRPCAFGSWAMPKLRRELHDKDPFVVLQAVLTISDLVHDPERGYEAVKLDVPARMADLLLEELPSIRENAAIALTTIAGLLDGKMSIVNNEELLENMMLCLGDGEVAVRMQIASLLELLSKTWMAADALVNYGYIPKLIKLVRQEQPEITALHLETLKALMYCEGKNIALNKENDGFKTFLALLQGEPIDVMSKALDCLNVLLATSKGKKKANEAKLLAKLAEMIKLNDIQLCTAAASCLMFCTVKTKAKIYAYDIKGLPKRLIELARNPVNAGLQAYSLQALSNISEHPLIRKEIQENYMQEVMDLQVGDNKQNKKTLLMILKGFPLNL